MSGDSWDMGESMESQVDPVAGRHKILDEAKGWHWTPGEIDEVPKESMESMGYGGIPEPLKPMEPLKISKT